MTSARHEQVSSQRGNLSAKNLCTILIVSKLHPGYGATTRVAPTQPISLIMGRGGPCGRPVSGVQFADSHIIFSPEKTKNAPTPVNDGVLKNNIHTTFKLNTHYAIHVKKRHTGAHVRTRSFLRKCPGKIKYGYGWRRSHVPHEKHR